MGDQHHRPVELLPDPLEPPLHLSAGKRIQRAERFIQEQDVTLLNNSAQKCGSLLHSPRQIEWVFMLESLESEDGDQ